MPFLVSQIVIRFLLYVTIYFFFPFIKINNKLSFYISTFFLMNSPLSTSCV